MMPDCCIFLRRFLPVGLLALFLISASRSLADKDAGGALAVVKRLGDNTRAIATMSYHHKHQTIFRSNVMVYERVMSRTSQVMYERANQEIRVEFLSPYAKVRHFDEEASPPPTKDIFTGYSLWALNPEMQVTGWQLSLGPTPSSGHVVVIGRLAPDRIPASGYAPHWEALVDQSRNRLISVTHYADSGEIERTVGFEAYESFANGRVLLPLQVVGRDYARLNRLEITDTFSDMQVQAGASGGRR